MKPKVIIITLPSCRPCNEAKELLKEKAIEFVELSVDNPDHTQELHDLMARHQLSSVKSAPVIFLFAHDADTTQDTAQVALDLDRLELLISSGAGNHR